MGQSLTLLDFLRRQYLKLDGFCPIISGYTSRTLTGLLGRDVNVVLRAPSLSLSLFGTLV